MPRAILLDIDGTILGETKDVSQYLFEAIRSVYGVSIDNVSISDYADMTIQETLLSLLAKEGIAEQDALEKMPQFFEELPYSHYNVAGHDSVSVAPGSKEMLSSLCKDTNTVIGIATGQLERITTEMLGRSAIGTPKCMRFGVYGDSCHSFSDITKAAANEAMKRFAVGAGSIYVVSSRPGMLSAAKSNGLHAIGLAGRMFNSASLSSAGAESVVSNMQDVPRLAK